ncbi:MAG: hypothetical protein ACKOK7_01735 [Solirubrobacterales bacterium]
MSLSWEEAAARVDAAFPTRAMADLLAGWCLEVEPGQRVVARSTAMATPLMVAFQEAVLAREAIAGGLAGCLEALEAGPQTAFEVVGSVHEGEEISPLHANLWVQETRSYLHHLEVVGDVARLPAESEGEADRWSLAR